MCTQSEFVTHQIEHIVSSIIGCASENTPITQQLLTHDGLHYDERQCKN